MIRALAIACTAACLAAAACGGDSMDAQAPQNSTDTTAAPASTTPATTDSAAPATTAAPATSAAPSGSAAPAAH